MKKQNTRTSHKPVAVIAGASRGIGKGFALKLAAAGYDLVLIARRAAALERCAEQCRSQGATVVVLPVDLQNTEKITEAVESIATQYTHIDLLWNGAMAYYDSCFTNEPDRITTEIIDCGVRGSILLTKKLLPLLVKSTEPMIMNVVCDWYFPRPDNGLTTFITAKYAIAGFTKALQQEYRGRVRVVMVNPSDVASEFSFNSPVQKTTRRYGRSKIPLGEMVEYLYFLATRQFSFASQINIMPLNAVAEVAYC